MKLMPRELQIVPDDPSHKMLSLQHIGEDLEANGSSYKVPVADTSTKHVKATCGALKTGQVLRNPWERL